MLELDLDAPIATAKKKRSRVKVPPSHDLDIYPVRLALITQPKQWRKYMNEKKKPEAAGMTASTLDLHTGRLYVTIWIDLKWHNKYGNDLDSTAVHEAVHASASILDHIGQTYDGNSEALAYLIDWMTEWIKSSLRS